MSRSGCSARPHPTVRSEAPVMLPNMFALIDDVQDGALDAVLVMPADTQVVISTRELQIWDPTGIPIGRRGRLLRR